MINLKIYPISPKWLMKISRIFWQWVLTLIIPLFLLIVSTCSIFILLLQDSRNMWLIISWKAFLVSRKLTVLGNMHILEYKLLLQCHQFFLIFLILKSSTSAWFLRELIRILILEWLGMLWKGWKCLNLLVFIPSFSLLYKDLEQKWVVVILTLLFFWLILRHRLLTKLRSLLLVGLLKH